MEIRRHDVMHALTRPEEYAGSRGIRSDEEWRADAVAIYITSLLAKKKREASKHYTPRIAGKDALIAELSSPSGFNSAEYYRVAASKDSLRVRISKLRAAGYVIETVEIPSGDGANVDHCYRMVELPPQPRQEKARRGRPLKRR